MLHSMLSGGMILPFPNGPADHGEKEGRRPLRRAGRLTVARRSSRSTEYTWTGVLVARATGRRLAFKGKPRKGSRILAAVSAGRYDATHPMTVRAIRSPLADSSSEKRSC